MIGVPETVGPRSKRIHGGSEDGTIDAGRCSRQWTRDLDFLCGVAVADPRRVNSARTKTAAAPARRRDSYSHRSQKHRPRRGPWIPGWPPGLGPQSSSGLGSEAAAQRGSDAAGRRRDAAGELACRYGWFLPAHGHDADDGCRDRGGAREAEQHMGARLRRLAVGGALQVGGCHVCGVALGGVERRRGRGHPERRGEPSAGPEPCR